MSQARLAAERKQGASMKRIGGGDQFPRLAIFSPSGII